MVMDCPQGSGFAGENGVRFQHENSEANLNENRGLGSVDRAVSATEDDISNHEGNLCQYVDSPNKRARNSLLVDSLALNRSEAIGKMFCQTDPCCKFQVAICPFPGNCNHAHSIEELKELPSSWQENVAADKEGHLESSETREVFQIPVVGFSNETRRPNTRHHCRNYYTEEGCPYGETCCFIHDKYIKDRESVAICLLPGTGGGCEGNGSKSTWNFSNWKTRICKKWELTGWCPFGSKCLFAHGSAELQPYGRGNVYRRVKNSSDFDTKLMTPPPAKASPITLGAPMTSVPHSYHIGVSSRIVPKVIPRTGEIPARRWKGPDKISKIYGDWIDDL